MDFVANSHPIYIHTYIYVSLTTTHTLSLQLSLSLTNSRSLPIINPLSHPHPHHLPPPPPLRNPPPHLPPTTIVPTHTVCRRPFKTLTLNYCNSSQFSEHEDQEHDVEESNRSGSDENARPELDPEVESSRNLVRSSCWSSEYAFDKRRRSCGCGGG
ncbi:hypothetical protein HanRHA438_Chr01g0036841 [Helianthus annuus]|nr:hypothetical protein HanRHA438_Chr01g0036841 [Helianthus annuus]